MGLLVKKSVFIFFTLSFQKQIRLVPRNTILKYQGPRIKNISIDHTKNTTNYSSQNPFIDSTNRRSFI